MYSAVVPAAVRTKLGGDAPEELVDMFAAYHQFATDRFERRLSEEIAGLRLELHQGLSGVRQEMAGMREDLIKWCLLFWVGQFTAIVAALSVMLEGR